MFQALQDALANIDLSSGGQLFRPDTLRAIPGALLVLIAGLSTLRIIQFVVSRSVTRSFSVQSAMLVRRGIRYTGVTVIVLMVLAQLQVNVAPLVGAAGIAGVAFGFAAQTSLSNVVSGLFMVGEGSFSIGDLVTVGDVTGLVESIDLLSIKIRTFDNRYIRVPNETVIKDVLINVTRFPIRRMDFRVTVPHGSDTAAIEAGVRKAAVDIPTVFDDPEPLFIIDEITPAGVEIFFGVWFAKADFLDVKNTMSRALLELLDKLRINLGSLNVVVSA